MPHRYGFFTSHNAQAERRRRETLKRQQGAILTDRIVQAIRARIAEHVLAMETIALEENQ